MRQITIQRPGGLAVITLPDVPDAPVKRPSRIRRLAAALWMTR